MSLRAFHLAFVLAALASLAFTAWWASGHNAARARNPAVLAASLAGVAVLAPYLAWRLRKP